MAVLRLKKSVSIRIATSFIWLILWGIILGSILLMSTFTDPFSYRSNRISPHDYKGSEWRSDNPFIYLKVQEDGQMKGYILLDSERIDIICGIDWGRFVTIVRETGEDSVRKMRLRSGRNLRLYRTTGHHNRRERLLFCRTI